MPKTPRKEIISSCRLREHYCPNMRIDIYNYIRNCNVCGQQKVDPKPRMGIMGSERQVKYLWQIIAVDISSKIIPGKYVSQ